MNSRSSARDDLHTLGLVASCIELVPNARLYMRPIQLHLLHFWKPITGDLEMIVPVTQHLKQHLHWWLNQANITKGRSLAQWSNSITITTDASKIGFGGHMNSLLYQGIWTKKEAQQHINMLELEAVCRTIAYFLPALQNQNVLLRCDNTTVVQYINKQGDQVCQSVLQSLGTVQNDNRSWHTDQSCSFIGASQHVGRPTVTSHNLTNRMDSEQSGSEQIVLSLEETNDRPICFRGQQQNAGFLHMLFFPESICSGCSVNSLEYYGGICVSSDLCCSQSWSTCLNISARYYL